MQALQCPKCGGTLGFAPQATRTVCGYCGGSIRISRDASGQPVATLEGIKTSTDILAADAARKRLEERLGDLQESYSQLYETYSIAKEAANRMTWIPEVMCAILGGVIGSLINTDWLFPLALVGVLVGLVLDLRSRAAAVAKVKEDYEPSLRRITGSILTVTNQLQAVTSQMDHLVMKM